MAELGAWTCPKCKKVNVMPDRDMPDLCVDCANTNRRFEKMCQKEWDSLESRFQLSQDRIIISNRIEALRAKLSTHRANGLWANQIRLELMLYAILMELSDSQICVITKKITEIEELIKEVSNGQV